MRGFPNAAGIPWESVEALTWGPGRIPSVWLEIRSRREAGRLTVEAVTPRGLVVYSAEGPEADANRLVALVFRAKVLGPESVEVPRG